LLARVPLAQPGCPLVSSVTGAPVHSPEPHRTVLTRQITAPVRWRDTVAYLAGSGVTRYVEVGPGRVLCGVGREMHRDAAHDTVYPSRTGQPDRPVSAAPGIFASREVPR
ncbi:MAG: hypothetical protein ACRDTJ_29070, partial [Pseudonocardiaceae bacterium]